MLSKLQFFGTGTGRPDLLAAGEGLQSSFRAALRALGRDITVTPARGGTLGVCFHADISGAPRFLKTHLPGAQARANLVKEADILIRLYGNGVILDRLDVRVADGSVRLCLVMAELVPLATPMQPEEAMAIMRSYTGQLTNYLPEHLAPSSDFEQYLVCAVHAVGELSERGLLNRGSAADLRRLIAHLQDHIGSQPRVVCHGDFGPKNIMSNGTQPIAIDWEDAFWGIAGYDYLYWLTFMENRPFLHRAAFGRTGLEPCLEHAILALIVLLKSFLSVRSGAYLAHAVSIQTRIAEVLDLE
ncbi:hypothetical protein ACVWZV_004506 [Bradyrhizobium sp. GM5.1]